MPDRKPQPTGLLNVLVSYAYMDKNVRAMVEALQGPVTWLLDSGAFTAFQQGKAIDFDEYCAFVRDHGHLFYEYIQLDSIGNPEISGRQLHMMADRGLRPMPVFVLGEGEEKIEGMAALNTRICVGGGVTESDEYYGALLERLWRRLDGQCDLHGLGYTRGTKVLRSRVSTVDSSSWMSAMRWGSFTWFDRLGGGFRNEPFGEMRRKPFKALPPAMQRVLVTTGVRPADLQRDVAMKGTLSLIGVQCAFAWLQFAHVCAQEGVRFFFAVPNRTCLMALFVAARHARASALDWPAARAGMPEVRAKLKDDRWLAEYVAAAEANLRTVFGDQFPGR